MNGTAQPRAAGRRAACARGRGSPRPRPIDVCVYIYSVYIDN